MWDRCGICNKEINYWYSSRVVIYDISFYICRICRENSLITKPTRIIMMYKYLKYYNKLQLVTTELNNEINRHSLFRYESPEWIIDKNRIIRTIILFKKLMKKRFNPKRFGRIFKL